MCRGFNSCSLFILLAISYANAQQEALVKLAVPASHDTNYYFKYKDRLVIGFYQASQNYNLKITQSGVPDPAGKSAVNLNANAASVNGIEIDYDKLSVSFSFRTLPQVNSETQGSSDFTGLGFSFGGDKWVLETSIRKYTGFYDLNSPGYDTSYKPGKPYYQIPSLEVVNTKFKFMYFANHRKFSYQAAYGNTERQIRSYFSMVYTANLYFNLATADTSMIPYYIRSYYGSNSDLNGFNTTAASAGIGITGTLVVFKRFFINGLYVFGLESQSNQYHHYFSGTTNSATYINTTGDYRVSLGFNNRNFFFTVNSINDFSQFQRGLVKMNANFISGNVTIGYRFKVKEPKVMPKIKETKIYQFF